MKRMWNKDFTLGRVVFWANYSNNDHPYSFGLTFSWLRAMLWLGPLLLGVTRKEL